MSALHFCSNLALTAVSFAYINKACAIRLNMLEACPVSSWDDNDNIPLGVVTVHVRPPSPSAVELDTPGTRWQYLDMDVLHLSLIHI
mgnify:FL=1